MSLNSVELVKDCTGLACQLARSNNEELYTTTIRIRITQEDDGFFLEIIAKPKSTCPCLKTHIKNNKIFDVRYSIVCAFLYS